MRTSFGPAGFLLPLVFLGSAACAKPAVGPAPVPAYSKAADTTWMQLTTWLPGSWTATTEHGNKITESFRLVSSGSALVETFSSGGGHETLSVYNRDRGSLLLTHYCAQGNQPRLRSGGTDANGITTFHFVDVTDLGGDEDVMVERRFQIRTGGTDDAAPQDLVQTEVYKHPDGTRETTTLRFVRARSDG